METQASTHRASIEDLIKAGAHFGHLTSRWNPKMRSYVFMERNGIHIIDLTRTQTLLDEAAAAAARFAAQGKTILFAGTKKQARDILRKHAEACDMPYVVERWLGGTLTNFQTIRRSIRRMEDLSKMEEDGTLDQLKKKERLMKGRERQKLEKVLTGIASMPRVPGALFVVDINREHIAVKEARKLGVPIIAMIDTNCDPDLVDFPIPANDDAIKSIDLAASVISTAIQEGLKQRDLKRASEQAEKDKIQQERAEIKAERAEKAKKAEKEEKGEPDKEKRARKTTSTPEKKEKELLQLAKTEKPGDKAATKSAKTAEAKSDVVSDVKAETKAAEDVAAKAAKKSKEPADAEAAEKAKS